MVLSSILWIGNSKPEQTERLGTALTDLMMFSRVIGGFLIIKLTATGP